MSDDRVGRVLGSEHTNTAAFRVVIDESEYLQLDDLVVVRTQVPKAGEVRTYGVVTEVEAVYEGASFESDTHRIAELGIMPAAKVRSAQVAVTRVDPEIWVSPDPGEAVERATGDERAKALYADEMGRPLPDRPRARRPAGPRRPRLLRRAQGRPHVDQRHQRCRHEDLVRAVLPPDADGVAARVGRGRGEPARARLQREGRGPALARHAQPPVRRRGRRGVGGPRRRGLAVPQRAVLGAAAPAIRRRPAARHRRTSGGRGRLHLDAARVHRRGAPALPVHRRQRPAQPDPVRARPRDQPVEAVGGERDRDTGRRRAAPAAAGRLEPRRGGPGHHRGAAGAGPAVARRRPRGLPRARGRLRGRFRVERQGDARHGSARSCGACITARPSSGTWCAPARATGSTGARPA